MNWYDQPPTVDVFSSPLWQFNSLAEMFATSRVVVRGTVKGATEGKTYPGSYTARMVEIEITEILRADDVEVSPKATIAVENGGYDLATEATFTVDEQPWLQVGDDGYFFLKLGVGSQQGLFFVADEAIIRLGDRSGTFETAKIRNTEEPTSLEQHISKTSPSDLAGEMAMARVQVEQGHVVALPDPKLEPAGLHVLTEEPRVLGEADLNKAHWVLSGAQSQSGYCYELVTIKATGGLPNCLTLDYLAPVLQSPTYVRRDVTDGENSVALLVVASGGVIAAKDFVPTKMAVIQAGGVSLDVYIADVNIQDIEVTW